MSDPKPLLFGTCHSEHENQLLKKNTVSSVLIFLIFVSIGVLAVGDLESHTRYLVYAVTALYMIVLFLIRIKLYRAAVPVLILFGSPLASLTVFCWEYKDHFEIYMLTSLYLFIIFISSLVSYNIGYTIVSFIFAVVAVAAHYLLRSMPYHADLAIRNQDDYIIALGLLVSSFIIIVHHYCPK